jgi:predicted DNA-binding transcriptional regulator YafY
MDPSSRMLRLLTLLQTHRFWPGGELSERLDVSARTLRRDIDRLRELGYPVRATRGAAGGYRLEAGTALPPLLLDDEEAVAIAVGLRTAASGPVAGIEETSMRALAKLEQVLPEHLRRRVHALQSNIEPLSYWRGEPIDAETLTVLAQACRDDERLQFEYRTREGETATRSVEPHRIVPVGRRWYLVAWDVHRSAWRTFRVDRMAAPRTSGARFNARDLPDAAAFVRDSLGSMPRRYEAVITVHAPEEETAEFARRYGGSIDVHGNLRMAGDSLPWLAAMIALLDVDFEVHEPPELVDRLRTLKERL